MVDNTQKRVVVAMSGGVDSSVAAALLVKEGYEVQGIMMRLWSEPGYFSSKRDNRCCTRDQMIDAHFVAQKLGIPFQIIDVQEAFRRNVVEQFVDGYRQGVTPNPCLSCNRHIRFTFLLQEALKRGANYLATGHYARITASSDGYLQLRQGLDKAKDQSYVLSVMTQAQLAHTLFPLGEYTKAETRAVASSFGLPVASKGESQDLCFVADGNYRNFLSRLDSQIMRSGEIVLRDGTVVGEHEGLPGYTIGQRKGLGIAWHQPLYVLEKDVQLNRLIVGTRDELGREAFFACNMNWIRGHAPEGSFRAFVKTRYKARPAIATITPLDSTTCAVQLIEPQPDITPGQGAVIYHDDVVLGSGLIQLELASPQEECDRSALGIST